MTWRDTVVFPAGWTLPDGTVIRQRVSARVIETDLDAAGNPVGPVRLELTRGAGPTAHRWTLDAALLGATRDRPRFRPGIVTLLHTADYGLLAIGVVLVGAVFPLQALRWLMLLRCRGLDVGFGKAFRLTMIGQFFNFCMPGMTGGDVVKAYYAARRSDNRGAAVMSVVFDRIAGLVGLVLLAGMVGLTMLGDPLVRRITALVWLGMAAVLLVSAAYFSRHLRRRLGIDRLIGRLPGRRFFRGVDAAALAYRDHKTAVVGATLLSLPVHLMISVATALAGYALGMSLPWAVLLTVVPVLLLAGAVPLTYQGLGVMEGIAIAMLLEPPLATANQIVGMLLMLRLFLIVCALAGSLTLLGGDVHMFPPAEEG